MSIQRKQMIVLSSITYAYKAKDFLYNKGIKCRIERIPTNLRVTGCGYGISVNADADLIADMLISIGIHVKQIIDL